MVTRQKWVFNTCKNHDQSMVNKKGYIKTLEAVIAIVIIVTIGYILTPRPTEPTPEVPPIVKGVQKIITSSIQFSETFRNILTKAKELPSPGSDDGLTLIKGVNETIAKNSPLGYDYTCAICSNPGRCLVDYLPLEKSIYVTDVIIASGEEQNPKIVRIWFWKKPTSSQDIKSIDAYNDCEIKKIV